MRPATSEASAQPVAGPAGPAGRASAASPASTAASVSTPTPSSTGVSSALVAGSQALGRIAAEVSGQLDLGLLFEDVIEHSCNLFAADRVGLWLIEPGRHPFRIAAHRGLSPRMLDAVSQLTSNVDAVGLRAVHERVPFVVQDATRNPITGALREVYVQDGVQTACLVPIVFRDESLGLLVLYHEQRHAWPPAELALAESFAHQMAVAIQNARLHTSATTLAQRLRSIQELTLRLARLTDPSAIAEAIVAEARQLVDAAVVRAYTVDRSRRVCEPAAVAGELRPYSDVYQSLPMRIGHGLVGWVAQHNEPLLTGNAAEDARARPPSGLGGEVSMLVLPLSYENTVRGVLALTRRGLDRFDADDLTTMTIFAGFAAQAVANAENSLRRRQQQAELEQLLASQRRLLEVNERLQTALVPEDVLELIADSLRSVVRYDNLSIYQVDREAGRFRAVLARDRFADVILTNSFPLDRGITGWVLAHREAQRVNDAHLDGRMQLVPGTPPEPESLIVVPLLVRGEVVGTLNVGRIGRLEAHFSDTEFELVKLFAGQASVALQNAQAHREVSTRAETDALTGLRNHGAFQNHLAELSAPPAHGAFGLVMLDLDQLKRVNDTLGHPAGDHVLRTAAASIASAVRETDRAYRYGGDEFAVLLPGADPAQTHEVGERICRAVRTAFRGSTTLTVSVGVGCFPADAGTMNELLARTDAALYRAKEQGGDRVVPVSRASVDQECDGQPGRPAVEVGDRTGHAQVPPPSAGTVDLATPSSPRHPSSSAHREAYLAALDEMTLALLSQLEPGELLEAIVRRAGGLAGTEDGYVYLVDEEAGVLELAVGVGAFAGQTGLHLARGQGLAGRVWASGGLVSVRDYLHWEGRATHLDHLAFHASVGLPLLGHGKIVGVLGLAQRDGRRVFGRGVVRQLERFAQLASVALTNARLYSAAQHELRERQRAELELQRSEARFRSLVQGTSDLVVALDASGRFTYVSPSSQRVLGMRPEELVGSSVLERVHPDDLAAAQAAFERLSAGPDHAGTFVVRMRHADGSWRTLDAHGRNLLHDPNVAGIVASGRDVTERQDFEAQLIRQALYDPLTGLPNRALLMDHLSSALGRARDADHRVALLVLDLDRFTLVNESYGHRAGDALLLGVARRLEELTRPGDTVARLGSDEFAVLLARVRGLREATGVAERLAERLEAPFQLDEQETYVSASVGIALGTGRGQDAADLLRDADVALHRAKSDSATRQAVFDPGMGEIPAERLELETDLRRAIKRDELVLHYQPIVDLADGRIVGAEALVRWPHPRRGLLAPDAFVGLAEQTGLILPLGRRVLEQACRQTKRWQDAQPRDVPLAINVNLSARQVARADLVATVQRVLHDVGLDPACLGLEITESALMEETRTTRGVLAALHALGVRLEIDDFGTGYSSLGYLRRLPVVGLKIDRVFVAGLGTDDTSASIIRAVVTLAHGLGLNVTAEGVETQDQLELLRDLHCDRGQGYHIARPMPAEEFGELLRARHS